MYIAIANVKNIAAQPHFFFFRNTQSKKDKQLALNISHTKLISFANCIFCPPLENISQIAKLEIYSNLNLEYYAIISY